MVDRKKTVGGQRDSRLIDELVHTVLSTVDMQQVLERTGAILQRRFGETRVSIHRIVPGEPDWIEIVYAFDPHIPHEGVGRRVSMAGSLCGEAIRARRPVALHRLNADKPQVQEERFLAPLGYQALASFPLIVEDKVLGTLDVAHFEGSRLLRDNWRDAEQIASILAIALNNSLMVEEVRRLNGLLSRENTALRQEVRRTRAGYRFIAESPLMQEVIHKVELVAASDATVLIRGETGTGKEGVARMVHDLSVRRDGHFVVVNLAAIPEQLIESELFGHEKGAFTGAAQRREGYFEAANGGTIFLDEVGDASLSVQVRLMRVLQQREIQRVGSSETIRVDVRVVAATHRSLEQMVEQGAFRSDLYYRLNIFPLHIPPLRERREDIRPLIEYFLARAATELHRDAPRFDDADLYTLENYPWPGNVRELENYVSRAVILSKGTRLYLPPLPTITEGGVPIAAGQWRSNDVLHFDEAVKELLHNALDRTRGRIHGPRGAAALLGLKPTTLQGKLHKYGIAPRDR
jgi:formate hydrogenlyase transcriptional activator